MRKGLYPRLAATNLKQNKKFYLPYLLACMGTVMMFCIMLTLDREPNIAKMSGGDQVRLCLTLGCIVIAIFSVIILFYTSSLLTKQRKKEFGLYNVLGMEKRHIGRVLLLENLYTTLMALVGGVLGSIVFSKLMQLLLLRLLGCKVNFGLLIDPVAIFVTCILYSILFLLIFLNTLRIIHLAKPVELLHGSQEGEREPKSKWLLAILGIICLGVGYAISMLTKDAVSAVLLFFVAVLFVIAGTYLLFTAFSTVFLKALRKNKAYYYHTSHFATVSGMLYRMKRNAAGLASICILSTMVLVTVSTTVSLYTGMNGLIDRLYPYDAFLNYDNTLTTAQQQDIRQTVNNVTEKHKLTVGDYQSYQYLSFATKREGDSLLVKGGQYPWGDTKSLTILWVTTAKDYETLSGAKATLKPGEALYYSDGEAFNGTLQLMSQSFHLTRLTSFPMNSGFNGMGYSTCYLVVDNTDTLAAIETEQQTIYQEKGSESQWTIRFQLSGTEEEKSECALDLQDATKTQKDDYFVTHLDSKQLYRTDAASVYGSFFFLGMFLGLLFGMATVLIIYYKQISEGYDDRERFSIMQKVGMTKAEVKSTIHTQVLIVFFLPLVTAAVHIAFAFPMIRHILNAFGMTDVSLFLLCTLATFAAFAVLYSLVYSLTARAYYGIVSK